MTMPTGCPIVRNPMKMQPGDDDAVVHIRKAKTHEGTRPAAEGERRFMLQHGFQRGVRRRLAGFAPQQNIAEETVDANGGHKVVMMLVEPSKEVIDVGGDLSETESRRELLDDGFSAFRNDNKGKPESGICPHWTAIRGDAPHLTIKGNNLAVGCFGHAEPHSVSPTLSLEHRRKRFAHGGHRIEVPGEHVAQDFCLADVANSRG
jgi:hypothetical protein